MKKVIILAAGKPHYGSNPSIFFNQNKYFNNFDVLKNILSEYSDKITVISGFKHKSLKKKIKANTIHNKEWKNTKSFSSLLLADFEKTNEIIVVYSDIIFNPKVLTRLIKSQKQISVISSSKNIKFEKGKEYLNIKKNKIHSIGSKIKKKNANSEFIGLVKIKTKAIKEIIKYKKKNLKISNLQISDLVDILIKKNLSYKIIDIGDEWIEIKDDFENVRKYLISSKANTLLFAKKFLKKSFVYPQISFTVYDWFKNKNKIITKIKKFSSKIIIRSSSFDEDNFYYSGAGKFLSFNNVKTKNPFHNKVENVIKSFGNSNKKNQILIQPSAKNIKCNGVVFTSNMESSFPSYIINLEFKSNDTSSITAGSSKNDKTFTISKYNLDIQKIENKTIKRIIIACKEIEELFLYESLDIEFAIDKNDKLFIFQIRPIVSKLTKSFSKNDFFKNNKRELNRFKKNIKELKHKDYLPILLGYMPDWNPAEIIGFKPNNLSFSLYEELVTNKVWAKQRDQFGYKYLKKPKLLFNFFGTPFVNVNKTFNSFLPKNINPNLEKKFLKFYNEVLNKNKHLHDKIEFEVIPTFYTPNFNLWKKKLKKAKFSENEVDELKTGLEKINTNIIKIFNDSKKKIEKLNNNYEIIINKKFNKFDKIRELVKECKINGTLPFAHFARIAFISISIFKDAVKKNIISQIAFDEFLNNLNTVSKTMSLEANLSGKNRLKKNKFIKKYSHLRPGTYDITSSNYSDNGNKILNDILQNNQFINRTNNKNWEKQKSIFLKYIQSKKIFDLKNASEIENFLKISIEMRELSKFHFTKYVNKILELIKEISKDNNLSLDDIAYLSFKDIFSIKKTKIKKIRNKISSNKLIYNINKNYELPHIISEIKDILQIEHLKSIPNFIGNFSISKKILLIDKNYTRSKILKDKIIIIESADPGYDWIFSKKIAGLITMFGGANSHMAIRTSELNLPAAIGVGKKKFLQMQQSNYVKLDPINKILERIE